MTDESQSGIVFKIEMTEPTPVLRWVRRRFDLVLQQAWQITTHDDHGKPIDRVSEWRDVPTVENDG